MPEVLNIAIIIIAIAANIYLLKRQVNLGILMVFDSVIVAVLARMPAIKALEYGFHGAFSESTISLLILLFLILMLENIMRTTGMIKNMVNSLKEIVGSKRAAAALMPAVIGLLPSPGGARLSCPMVDEVIGNGSAGTDKAFVNYWFRHIWMDAFILYPGAILASRLVGISVISFFLHLLPFIIITIIIGLIFGVKNIEKEKIERTQSLKENFKVFFLSILPVILVIAMYIVLLNHFEYSLELSVLTMVAVLFISKKYDLKRIIVTMKESFPVKLMIILIGAMIFKQIVLESKVLEGLPGFLESYGIPVSILFLLLPFIGGFSSGIVVSYISLTFPFLLPLGLDKNVWYAVLAFSAGYVGNMVTPLHLCAVMTADYFKAPVTSLLKKVATAGGVLLIIVSVILFIII